MSASGKPNKSDQREDEVTLASSPGMEPPKPIITDDESTAHDDTTTHERRRHLVKPIILGMPNENPPAGAERARVRTLRSVGAPKKRSRWLWPAIIACLGGGGLIAWRTSQSRTRARPPSPSATQTAQPTASAESPPLLKLSLDIHVEPAGARVQLDGKPLEKTAGVEMELPCPRGFHELRVEAKDHDPLVKRIPCEGRVVMDLSLDDR